MKNKKEEQIINKKEHKERLKKRGQPPELVRNEPTKNVKPTILIVCEGLNTEPSYFNQFRLSNATIKTFGGKGVPTSVVNEAIKLKSEKNYDQVWCVFDKDDHPNFNLAIQKACKNRIRVAYSNQAFEYWFILHFEDHQGGGMNRTEYNENINQYINPLGAKYEGNNSKKISEKFFDLLMGTDLTGNKRVELAIKRAKRNYKNFHPHINREIEESSTRVFKLVEEILKYL